MPTASVASDALRLSELRAALAARPGSPLTVVWTDGEPIEAHFHVTEVGRVQRDFIDCGGTVRRSVVCLLQTWVGEDTDHRITAGKLLKAIELAAPVLGSDDLPVELEYEACNVVQVKVAAIESAADALLIRVAGKHTDCLAKELCLTAPASAASSCCKPGQGCC